MDNKNHSGKEIFEVLMRLKRLSFRYVKAKDLHTEECICLKTIKKLKEAQIDDSTGVKTSEIGAKLNMKKPATSKMLNTLEDGGYITRVTNKKDRRVTYINLTEEGILLMEEHRRSMEKYSNQLIQKMGQENMEQLVELINRLSNCIEELIEEE